MKYSHNADQISIFNFGKVLKVNLDKNHELVKMEALVPWDELVDAIASTYKDAGRPSKSIRLMLGLLIIKHKYGIADEELIERLKGDIYFQYFCGFDSFIESDSIPDSSSLTYFRKRLTPEILQKIENAIAIKLIKKLPKKRRHSIMVDTTCMPANVTFPTDTKLLSKTYEKLLNFGKSIGLKVIRGKRRIKAFIRGFNLKRNKTKKEIVRARKKLVRATKGLLKKIRNRIGKVANTVLEIAEKIIEQQDKRNKGKTNIIEDRIVSFHEPTVRPIKRGKDGINCEFGKKVAISVIGEGIAVSTRIDNNNFDDREIIKAAIEKHNRLTERDPTEIIMDRGGDSKKNHDELKERRIKDGVQRKGRQKEKPTRVQKRQHNRRSVVEGKIGTGKQFYGLNRNRYREKNAEVWLIFGLAVMNLTWATRKAA